VVDMAIMGYLIHLTTVVNYGCPEKTGLAEKHRWLCSPATHGEMMGEKGMWFKTSIFLRRRITFIVCGADEI